MAHCTIQQNDPPDIKPGSLWQNPDHGEVYVLGRCYNIWYTIGLTHGSSYNGAQHSVQDALDDLAPFHGTITLSNSPLKEGS